jgi:hypothetical protein
MQVNRAQRLFPLLRITALNFASAPPKFSQLQTRFKLLNEICLEGLGKLPQIPLNGSLAGVKKIKMNQILGRVIK